MKQLTVLLYVILFPLSLLCQTDSPSYNSISQKALININNYYSKLNVQITKHSLTLLESLQKSEAGIKKILQNQDSNRAQQLFIASEKKYQKLQNYLQEPVSSNVTGQLKQYIAGMDSMQTAMQFLSNTGLPFKKLQQIKAIGEQLQQLQGSLQKANEIQDFARQREQQLKAQLSQFGKSRYLMSINREVYYYQGQLSQFKSLLNNPRKQQDFVLATVRELPAFKSFWKKNSIIAQLFPEPEGYGTVKALAGLQTREELGNIISQRLGGTPSDQHAFLQKQLLQGQGQLEDIKSRFSNNLISGSGDMTMPDFKPNSQHTKGFLQRLEYGFNIQNNSSTNLLPTISTIGVMIGYKISDKMTVGLGMSYLLGFGSGLNHIRLSNEGAGMRSFVDIKARGSIWVTGGYECNYMQSFSGINDIKNIDLWQKSGLIGLTKKYKIGKRDGNFQLLYDLLATYQTPRGHSFKFRIGYSF